MDEDFVNGLDAFIDDMWNYAQTHKGTKDFYDLKNLKANEPDELIGGDRKKYLDDKLGDLKGNISILEEIGEDPCEWKGREIEMCMYIEAHWVLACCRDSENFELIKFIKKSLLTEEGLPYNPKLEELWRKRRTRTEDLLIFGKNLNSQPSKLDEIYGFESTKTD